MAPLSPDSKLEKLEKVLADAREDTLNIIALTSQTQEETNTVTRIVSITQEDRDEEEDKHRIDFSKEGGILTPPNSTSQLISNSYLKVRTETVERVPLTQEVTTALPDGGKDDIERTDKAKLSPIRVDSEGISSDVPTKRNRAEIRAKGSTAINKGKLEKKEGGQNTSDE
eukprot:8502935-Ditylum_brightwellii.AAC.1